MRQAEFVDHRSGERRRGGDHGSVLLAEEQQIAVALVGSPLVLDSGSPERVSALAIAYLHDQERQGLQKFLGQVPWQDLPLRACLAQHAAYPVGNSPCVGAALAVQHDEQRRPRRRACRTAPAEILRTPGTARQSTRPESRPAHRPRRA